MKTSVDVLVGLLAVKELDIRMKSDRINQLINMYNALLDENAILRAELAKPKAESHELGFKTKGGPK